MKKADIITRDLMRDLISRNQDLVIPNFYIGTWECDVFSLLKSGYTNEYEIKTSKADFRNDSKKAETTYNWGERTKSSVTKEQNLQEGKRANRFYYVVPDGLIKKEEVPSYAGLIYAVEDRASFRRRAYSFCLIKQAKLLHANKLERKGLMHQIAQKTFGRYLTLFYENRDLKEARENFNKKIHELLDQMIAEREQSTTMKPIIQATETTLLKLLKMEIAKIKT